METILQTELLKSAIDINKHSQELGASYNKAMLDALDIFKKNGLPTKKMEDWRYTNIAKNISPRFFSNIKTEAKKIQDESLILDARAVIVFNNGIFNQFHSILPEGLSIDQHVFSTSFFDTFDALNFSTALSPLFLKVSQNSVFDYPITIIHQIDENGVNKISTPRINIKAEKFSQASFVEIFTSTQNSLVQYTTNSSTNFIIDENAKIEHVKIQHEATQSTHIGLTKAKLSRDARFYSMTIDLGNLVSRHNLEANLDASGSEAQINGLYSLDGLEHCDVFSSINHNAAHTESQQLFKGLLAGESHGVFTGKIIIAKDAQQVNSNQLNKNLMLSKKAHIDTRPQLLVAADDVKCAHGATIGQLSPEEEFYLESRGINKEKAKRMLCLGFALDVIMKIENQIIQNLATNLTMKKFEKMDNIKNSNEMNQ